MGLEPTTSWLPVKRSSQLSYIPFFIKHLNYNHLWTESISKFAFVLYKISEKTRPPPFTDLNDQGLSGVFDEDAVLVKVVKIIDEINENAVVA